MEHVPWKHLIAAVVGGGAGLAYYALVGCHTG
jgi:hypothetical protein